MREVGKNNHHDLWAALMDKKFKTHEPITKPELDQILGPYNALADFPATIFATELMEHYPEAKVVLVSRDEQGWYDSMCRTVWGSWKDPERVKTRSDMQNAMAPMRDRYHLYCWDNDFPKNGLKYFQDYKKEVRQKAPQGVLEYSVGDGWEPLCKMLGVEVPDTPFPNNDEARPAGVAGSKKPLPEGGEVAASQ